MINRALIITIIIVSLVIVGIIGCSCSNLNRAPSIPAETPTSVTKDKPTLSKDQVRTILSDWLNSKAQNKTMREALRWSSSLYWETTKYEYIGSHEWVIAIPYRKGAEDILSGSTWQVNEVTRTTKPLNDWAILTLFVMTHEIYKNPSFGYSLVYPCGWQFKTSNEDADKIFIFHPNVEAYIMVSVRKAISQNIEDEVILSTDIYKSTSYEFVLIASEPEDKNNYKAWKLTYIHRIDESDKPYKVREHFILKNGYIYDVLFAALDSVFTEYSAEFDFLYNRFSLQ